MVSQIKKRNPIAVFLLPIVTLGIYSLYWFVKTKGELNRSGAERIPTAWWWLVPFVGQIYWLWKYSKGAAQVTNNRYSDGVCFLLLFLLSCIGSAIMQSAYNELESAPVANVMQ